MGDLDVRVTFYTPDGSKEASCKGFYDSKTHQMRVLLPSLPVASNIMVHIPIDKLVP